MPLLSGFSMTGSSPLTLLLAAALASGVFVICTLVHRLSFHQLAKYPGPFLHKLCGIPTLYHAWKGDLHYHLYTLHQKYGEHVRYSPNKLSICNLSAVNDIYSFNRNVGKPEEFYSAFRINKHAINTFNTSSKEIHRRKRRIMAKAFSEVALISYEGFIAERVAEFMAKLRSLLDIRNGEFDFAYEFNCLMLDIMGGLCFGEAFGFGSGRGDEILKLAHQRTFRIYMTGHEPFLKRSYLDRLIFPGLFRASNVLGNYAKMHTTNRISKYESGGGTMSADKGHSDIMSHLLDAGDEETGTKYSANELLGEGVLMMMAGSDTSSSALTATLFYLAHHPRALATVRSELHSMFPTLADIQPRKAETCTYLRACMDEAMRLSPPAPTNIPRVVGTGGHTVAGDYFAEGTYVGVPNFALFRDERYFGGNLDQHAFVPERWIAGSVIIDARTSASVSISVDDVKLAQLAFLPFSMGPRHCIGSYLAMKEVSFILATLLYEFDIETVGNSGVLKRTLPGIFSKKEHVVMEQADVYTSLEHDVLVRLRKPKAT